MINGSSLNTENLNGTAEFIPITFAGGTIAEFEQTVAHTFSGTAVEFEQDVEFRATFSGSAIELEQSVSNSITAQTCIEFEQRVISLADTKCVASNWDLILSINGVQIPNSQIIDEVTIDRSENDASLLKFTLKPGAGIQDETQYQGLPVTVDVVQGLETTRVFTGIVDIPEFDLRRERITYRCTDRRREQINTQLSTVVKSIGYYTTAIFGEPEDTADELDKRLTTVPLAVDFDAYGNYTLSSLFPKATPDYTLSSSDIFRRNPRVEVASRARLINQVTFDFEYRYTRLHHRQVGFSWTHPAHPSAGGFCLFAIQGYSLTAKEMVRQAANAAGWQVAGDIAFTEVWSAGWYDCGGEVPVAWSPIFISGGTLVEETDEDGNTITDSDGKPQYTVKDARFTDTGSLFCLGATWAATNRWAQTLGETYTATVKAPQSIAQYGILEEEASYGLESQYDSAGWEGYNGHTIDAGSLNSLKQTIVDRPGSFYIDVDDERSNFNESYLTALNIAKTTILSSHRDNRIILELEVFPEIDLKHTVQVSSNKVDGKGKVSAIRHVFDISDRNAFTEVELSFSRSQGSASDSSLSIPSAPSLPVSKGVQGVGLGNQFGINPANPGAEYWTGMIGNRFVGGVRTQYPESFVVATPDIEASARNQQTGSASATYDVSIDNDPFEITFEGKCD